MEQLNFPAYAFTLKNKENKTYILDLIRKKNLLLTPEEWVRQHCINFLNSELGYPNNMTLNSMYLMLTNGKDHYFCFMDFENKTYRFISELPKYNV